VTSSRRIFRNTAVQLAGEIPGKLLTLVFYVFMARQLGQKGFGDFVFALSLSLLCTVIAGFGTDAILTREVVRVQDRLRDLFWSAIGVKLTVGFAAVAVAFTVATIGDYSNRVRVAVLLLGFASVIELISKTIGATFQAHHDLRPLTVAGVIQRLWTAVVGIAALALGAGVVLVAAIWFSGAVAGLAYAARSLIARGLAPRVTLSGRHTRWLVVTSFPIGVTLIFSTIVFRADATILSLMKSNVVVGLYGAAYQLLEATLFLSYAFVAAVWPTLSQLGPTTRPTIGQAYESACKVLAALLLPLGTGFVLFAEPVTELVYGGAYADAVTAVRLLGGAVAIYGLRYLSAYVLIAQDRQAIIALVTAAIAVENVALNLVLIPSFSLEGAAAATSISEASMAVLLVGFCLRRIGRISVSRILAGPAIGCAAITVVALVGGANIPTLAVAAVTYLLVLLIVERLLHPADVRVTLDALRHGRVFS
jgi:O-antigen/teichoic acid export membrane protein